MFSATPHFKPDPQQSLDASLTTLGSVLVPRAQVWVLGGNVTEKHTHTPTPAICSSHAGQPTAMVNEVRFTELLTANQKWVAAA